MRMPPLSRRDGVPRTRLTSIGVRPAGRYVGRHVFLHRNRALMKLYAELAAPRRAQAAADIALACWIAASAIPSDTDLPSLFGDDELVQGLADARLRSLGLRDAHETKRLADE